jgi:hypothetical protein
MKPQRYVNPEFGYSTAMQWGGRHMNLKFAIGAVALAAMSLTATPIVTHAQDNADDSTQMVTGCLKMGSGDTFSMTDEQGKMWVLHSKNVQLGPHVGHTVTITGTIPQKSKDQNNTDGNTSPQNNLRVTNLKMVSETCEK